LVDFIRILNLIIDEASMNANPDIEIHPLTRERWEDFEKLFGPHGVCGGCWCMFWKMPRKDFLTNRGEGNRLLQKAIVDAGEKPGLLAYIGGNPVGWCAIEPRGNYSGLERSRIFKPIDDLDVWSVSCFYVDRKFRFQGISTALLSAAVGYAGQMGARIVEGYPTEAQEEKMPAPFVYTGLASGFIQAGFKEAARRSAKRPMMRYYIK
jgi:GNAT superfamily N-acetyltransferase